MGPLLTLRRIILPQAMRAILPGMANDTIGMIKGTSIASVIFVNELTFRSQQIVGQNFKFFTVFAAAGIIYLMLTSAISLASDARSSGASISSASRRPAARRAGRAPGLPSWLAGRLAPRPARRVGARRPRRAAAEPRPNDRAHGLLGASA